MKQEQIEVPKKEGHVFIPSINLYVPEERTLLDKTWGETQDELKDQGLMMPTPRQFRETLRYLRDNHGKKENKRLYIEITENMKPPFAHSWLNRPRIYDPDRGEGCWLNGRFEERADGRLDMISENVLKNGRYLTERIKLEDFCNETTVMIDLDKWLDSDKPHGLPPRRSNDNENNLSYYAPEFNSRSIRFEVESGGTVKRRHYTPNLICVGIPSIKSPDLGVFACAEGPLNSE